MKWLLAVSLPFFVIDQITKELVLRYVPLDVTIPVIPGFFNIIQAHNTGAAFSMFGIITTFSSDWPPPPCSCWSFFSGRESLPI